MPQQLLDDFTAQYGIKVNYDTYSSNEEMLAKLQAGASGYDLVIPSDYTVVGMLKQDLLQPIDLAQIPIGPLALYFSHGEVSLKGPWVIRWDLP